MIRNNRGGITFPLLITVFSFILLFLSVFTIIGPQENAPKDLEYGASLTNLYVTQMKLPAEGEFFTTSLEKGVVVIKNSLGKEADVYLGSTKCVSDNVVYFYDESLPLEERITGYSSNDSEIREEVNVCLPLFTSSLSKELETFSIATLSSQISSGVVALETQYENNIEYDPTTNKLLVDIDTTYNKETQRSRVELKSGYNSEFDFSSYVKMFSSLQKNLPNLSNYVGQNLQSCVANKDNSSDSRSECLEELISNHLFEEDLDEAYELETGYILQDGYYDIDINIYDRKTRNLEFDFSVRLEDRVPFNLVEFELSEFERNNNVIRVRIPEPEQPGNKNLHGFIILYSYDNFFSQSYQGYNELVGLLKEGQIPFAFNKVFTSEDNEQYFVANDSLSGLNLVFVPWDGAYENPKTQEKFVRPLLSQISQGGDYVRLENKPVHVFVFAIDDKYTYYVNEPLLESNMKQITPKSFFGPQPVVDSQLSLDEGSQSESISLSVEGYEDSSFDHYDLYITRDRGDNSLKENCNDVSYQCHYFNGEGQLTSQDTSISISYEQASQGVTISPMLFNGESQFELISGVEYEVFVIPSDNQGRVSIEGSSKTYSFVETSSQGFTHFTLEGVERAEADRQRITLASKTAIIRDTTPPHPLDSISVYSINACGNTLCLQWASNQQGDVERLSVTVKSYNSEEGEISSISKHIGIVDNSIPGIHENAEQVVVEDIIPIDYARNKMSNYQGETYSVSWP